MDFNEGVRPGGLTTNTEIRILLCYLLDTINAPVTRDQLEEVLLGEERVNYFLLADSLAQLCEQGLVRTDGTSFTLSDEGKTIGRTLVDDVPRTIREAAVRGVIRAQQYAAKAAANHSKVIRDESGRHVNCSIGDEAGALFKLELYMPDDLTAELVRDYFIQRGDKVYKLVLAALTGNQQLAEQTIEELSPPAAEQ